LRIIGGEKRGHKLTEWHGADIRPLRDRVRTALFDILGQRVVGAEFLDLFAGTGAVGLEALSRGARAATFVDASGKAIRIIRENLRRLGYQDRAQVIKGDALEAVRKLARRGKKFDLVFVGAPYGGDLALRAATLLGELAPLSPEATVVVEVFHKAQPGECYGHLELESVREYGETKLLFYRRRA
jgi:16S rRNA (guanine(966)-N(2))-methyltransferase RsmD